MKKFFTLLKTELRLSFRSPDVLIFGMAMPLIVVALVGLIYGKQTAADGVGMLEFSFGAYISIGICAFGLMSLPLVLSDYRNKKILKRLQVTPVHPGTLLSVQFAVQLIMSVISALLVSLFAALVFNLRIDGSLFGLIPGYFLVMAAIFSIGLLIASTAKDVRQAGILCSIAYFPMLIFSGTTVPYQVFPEIVQKIFSVLPLRMGIALLNGLSGGLGFADFIPQIIALVLIAVLCVLVSVFSFKWEME